MSEVPKQFTTGDFLIAALAAREALRNLIEVMQSQDETTQLIEPHLVLSSDYAKELARSITDVVMRDTLNNAIKGKEVQP